MFTRQDGKDGELSSHQALLYSPLAASAVNITSNSYFYLWKVWYLLLSGIFIVGVAFLFSVTPSYPLYVSATRHTLVESFSNFPQCSRIFPCFERECLSDVYDFRLFSLRAFHLFRLISYRKRL